MNPSSNEMQLPPPIAEQAPSPNTQPEAGPAAPEQANPSGVERASNAQQPAMPMPSIPLPIPTAHGPAAQQSDVSSTTQTSSLAAASDTDLIEKEWVTKAKQIVEHTRDDPYRQSEELTGVKVDYMKKRYNKTIKLNK